MKLVASIPQLQIPPYVGMVVKPEAYVLGEEETDATGAFNIELCYQNNVINYAQKKDCYQYLGKSIATLGEDDLNGVLTYCGVSAPTCIQYYMQSGLTLAQAQALYISNRSRDLITLAACCSDNSKNNNIIEVLMIYLPQAQIENFVISTQNLIYLYANYAVYGQVYGNYIPGILDYVQDYGTYAGKGLSTYTLNPGQTLANLVATLTNLLTNGRDNILIK